MPIVIAALGILATAYAIYMRTRCASRVVSDLVDAVSGAGLAARRFRFLRKTNVHPVENITDPETAIAGIAAALVEIEGASTLDRRKRLTVAIAKELGVSAAYAEELAVYGRWLVTECGTADAAVARISRKLYRLSGTQAVTPLLRIVNETLLPDGRSLSVRQKEALADVSTALRLPAA